MVSLSCGLVIAFCFPLFAFHAAGGKATTPAVPSNLTAKAVATDEIDLAWKDNAYKEQGFKILRALSSAGPWTQIGTVGTGITNYADTTLNPSTKYYYEERRLDQKSKSPNKLSDEPSLALEVRQLMRERTLVVLRIPLSLVGDTLVYVLWIVLQTRPGRLI